MATLPDLVGRIRLDMSEMAAAQSEATTRGAAIGSALGSAVGNLAGGALAAVGSKITEFVGGSIDAFAKLQDSTQAAGVVFGSSFGKVEQFANQAASSLGISKSAALDASLTFGTFGKSAGLAGDDLAGFSNKMVGLAGDMASFRGTSPQEAIEAIGAAFRGEYDPIEKYGVLINANTVKQEAERLGLIKHGQELDNHSRIMATQSLIYKQTADAQGDFTRSGDSVANTQKRIAAETENAQAALGEKLAPAYLALLNALNPVITGLTTFIGVVTDIAKFIWEWKDAIAAVLVVLGILNAQTIAFNVAMAAYLAGQTAIRVATTAWTAVQWLLNAALTANPIGLVVAAIAALAAGIVIAYNHSATFRAYVDELWKELQQFIAWVGPAWETFKTGVVNAFTQANAATDKFWNSVSQGASNVGTWLVQANTATDNFWHGVANAFTQANSATDTFWQRVGQLPGQIGSALGPLAGQVVNWVVSGFTQAKDGVAQANQFLIDQASQLVQRCQAALSGFAQQVVTWVVDGWNRAKDGVNTAIGQVVGFVQGLPGRISQLLSGMAQQVYDWVAGGFNRLPQGIQSSINTVVGYVQGLAQQIGSALQALPGQMVTMGNQIIQGLLTGLQQLGPQIVSYLTNLIPEPVRRALNIASPSGVMKEIGTQIMQGLDQGISSLIPQLQAKMAQIGTMLQQQGQQAAAAAANALGSLDLKSISNVKAQINAQGASGSATIGGQQVSGSISRSGQISGNIGGHTFNVDARSFGTQLKPQDVADAIKWASKIGGLVPA